MWALRHEARALSRLAQLAQCPPAFTAAASCAHGGLASGSSGSAAWAHATVRHAWGMGKGGEDGGSSSKGGGGITGWLTSKLPAMLGGDKIEDLDIETFGTSLKRARQLGGLTGFVHGTTSINDGQAQGTLRLFEQIIDAMRLEEKQDLKLFTAAARQRVAAEVGTTVRQVDDCIARYLWTRQMTLKLAQLKKEGKPMPTSMDEVDRMLGSWRQYKTEADGAAEGGVPLDHVSARGQRCGLAGQPVSRNTKCPLTRKAFKACCGKTLRIGGS